MREFDDILRRGCSAVHAEYFLLPIDGAESVHRERVYCYELYHQLRSIWPNDAQYILNGEVDKARHPYFPKKRGAPKPDFLVHVPGEPNNYAVIEVKCSLSFRAGLTKDFATLGTFKNFGYARGIYLLFGSPPTGKVQERLLRKAEEVECEVWFHARAGDDAIRLV